MPRRVKKVKPKKKGKMQVGEVVIESMDHTQRLAATKHPPEFKTVRFGDIEMWDVNPRIITPEKLQALARSIEKYGLFKTLTVWPKEREKGKYVVGGGNMRYRAMKEILGYSDDEMVEVCVVTPRSYAEKIEISLLDNQSFGFYDTLEVAKLIKPHVNELDMGMLAVDIESPISLEQVVEDVDEAEDSAPLSPEAEYRESDGKTYVPIGADLIVVSFGSFGGVVQREVIDKIVSSLSKRFGSNRSERELAGEWIAKYLIEVLTEEVGPPSNLKLPGSEEFMAYWQEMKESQRVAKQKEYEEWRKKVLSKKRQQ